MRATTAFNRLLALHGARVVDVLFGADSVTVRVALVRRRAVCSRCGQVYRSAYDRSWRRWRHHVGDFTEATWSPHGLFVAGVRGNELSAVDPDGNVHWTLTAPATVADPRWGPDGFRIAYRSGTTMRVVAGDGSGDHVVGRDVAAVAPAWRPDNTHTLAFVTPAGGLFLSRVDDGTGRLLAHRVGAATWLAWAGRHRLLVATPRTLVTTRDRTRRSWNAPSGTTIAEAATSPVAPRVAVVLQGPGLSKILLLDDNTLRRQRTLLTIRGTATDLTWSPDGRWLTAAQPDTGRWLMIPLEPGAETRAVTGLAAALGAPASRARPLGWCCSREP